MAGGRRMREGETGLVRLLFDNVARFSYSGPDARAWFYACTEAIPRAGSGSARVSDIVWQRQQTGEMVLTELASNHVYRIGLKYHPLSKRLDVRVEGGENEDREDFLLEVYDRASREVGTERKPATGAS